MQHERLDLERVLRAFIFPLNGKSLDADVVSDGVGDVSGAFAGPFVMVADVAGRRDDDVLHRPRPDPRVAAAFVELAVEVQAPRVVPVQYDLDPAGFDRFVQSVPVFRDTQVDAVVGAVVAEVLEVVDWHFFLFG